MPSEPETIRKIEGGILVVKVDGKKLGAGNCPWGTLILTDKRLLFAAAPRNSDKVTLAAIFTPPLVHQTGMRLATQVKPEEIPEAMKDERSFYAELAQLAEIRSGGNFWTNYKLHVTWYTPASVRMVEFQKGGAGGFGSWVKAIKSVKEGKQLAL